MTAMMLYSTVIMQTVKRTHMNTCRQSIFLRYYILILNFQATFHLITTARHKIRYRTLLPHLILKGYVIDDEEKKLWNYTNLEGYVIDYKEKKLFNYSCMSASMRMM